MSKVKASGIFIVRKDKSLLICHPTNHDPNFWSIPKGKIEDDESILEAGIRETYEESNIDLVSLGNCDVIYLGSKNYTHMKKMLYAFLYLERDDSDIDWDSLDIKCISNVPADKGGFPEMDAHKFCSLEEAEKQLHYTQTYFIPKIQEILNDNK